MKKIITIAVSFVMCVFVFCACASNSVSGSYEMSYIGKKVVIELGADGNFTYTVPIMAEAGTESLKPEKVTKGKYTIDGDIITFKFKVTDDIEGEVTKTATASLDKDDDGKILSLTLYQNRDLVWGKYRKK